VIGREIRTHIGIVGKKPVKVYYHMRENNPKIQGEVRQDSQGGRKIRLALASRGHLFWIFVGGGGHSFYCFVLQYWSLNSELYHLSHTSSSFFALVIFQVESQGFTQGKHQIMILLVTFSHLTRDTGAHLHS
jgi:hypothetical protein